MSIICTKKDGFLIEVIVNIVKWTGEILKSNDSYVQGKGSKPWNRIDERLISMNIYIKMVKWNHQFHQSFLPAPIRIAALLSGVVAQHMATRSVFLVQVPGFVVKLEEMSGSFVWSRKFRQHKLEAISSNDIQVLNDLWMIQATTFDS